MFQNLKLATSVKLHSTFHKMVLIKHARYTM